MESQTQFGTVRVAVARLEVATGDTSLAVALARGEAALLAVYGAVPREEPALDDPLWRALLDDPGLPLPARELRQAVRVTLAVYGAGIPHDALGISHVRAVLALRPDDQVRLLRQAAAHQWTVRELDAQVACLDKRHRGGPGRPRRHPALRTRGRLESLLEDPGTAFGDLAGLAAQDRHETLELMRTLRALGHLCDQVHRELGRALSNA